MLSNIVASSEDLAMLTRVLDDYCLPRDISAGQRRNQLGRVLIDVFGSGVNSEADLKSALTAARP